MASGPTTSWQIDGETMETVTEFIFLGSKTTADDDCLHKIKMLASWNKSCDKPRQHIKKTKIHIVKAMVFPVVRYRCERWTLKKAQCRRIDAFELWCWK